MALPASKHNDNYHTSQSTVSIKTFLITILAAIIIIFSLWAYKSLESGTIIRENKQQNQQFKKNLYVKLDSTLKKQLLIFSKPLVWAVRSKLLDGDMKAVDMYLGQLVTEKNFEEVSVINNKGLIIASSKKSEIDHFYSTFYNRNFLSADTAKLNVQRGNSVIITSPIYVKDSRIATLSIHYLMPAKE